jgi:hypothetical protein
MVGFTHIAELGGDNISFEDAALLERRLEIPTMFASRTVRVLVGLTVLQCFAALALGAGADTLSFTGKVLRAGRRSNHRATGNENALPFG